MAPKLKDHFDERVVRAIAADLRRAQVSFDERGFVRDCLRGLAKLELTGRARHVARVMRGYLPESFERSAAILVASLGPELERSDEFGMGPFRYLPHVFYVAEYGLDDLEPAFAAQYELTKRFTAEFSIRAFLLRHPEATLARLRRWTADANVHVRRLVSEGTRPRLPWAPRLRPFQQDPAPVLELLERLKDDPERYVQRSVANNLNDIAKDHPALAVETCRRWLVGASPARRWIVSHALRSLVKAAHPGALEVLGFAARPAVEVERARFTPRRLHVGEVLRFGFELASTSRRTQELLVDYVVHFVKASGATRPKVFKLSKVELPGGARVGLAGKVSFQPMTTRRPYPGRHRIDVLVNGVAFPVGEFQVLARAAAR